MRLQVSQYAAIPPTLGGVKCAESTTAFMDCIVPGDVGYFRRQLFSSSVHLACMPGYDEATPVMLDDGPGAYVPAVPRNRPTSGSTSDDDAHGIPPSALAGAIIGGLCGGGALIFCCLTMLGSTKDNDKDKQPKDDVSGGTAGSSTDNGARISVEMTSTKCTEAKATALGMEQLNVAKASVLEIERAVSSGRVPPAAPVFTRGSAAMGNYLSYAVPSALYGGEMPASSVLSSAYSTASHYGGASSPRAAPQPTAPAYGGAATTVSLHIGNELEGRDHECARLARVGKALGTEAGCSGFSSSLHAVAQAQGSDQQYSVHKPMQVAQYPGQPPSYGQTAPPPYYM